MDEFSLSVDSAGDAVIAVDLGYTPNKYTNLNYNELQGLTVYDESTAIVQLTTPVRAGYTFAGWFKEDDETSVTGSYSLDTNDDLNNDGRVTIKAKWTANEYWNKIAITFDMDQTYLEISMDGGQTYVPLDVANTTTPPASGYSWNGYDLIVPVKATYGETIGEILNDAFGSTDLILRDTRAAGTAQEVYSWLAVVSGGIRNITMDTKFEIGGDAGYLLNIGNNADPVAYMDQLTYQAISPVWGTMKYDLNLTGLDTSIWTILVNNVAQTPVNNVIRVVHGSTVSFRVSSTSTAANANFSRWQFTGLTVEYPEERTYDESSAYLYYDFTMPTNAVDATFTSGNVYFDISEGSINITKNVTLDSGRVANGFWYDELMTPSTLDGNKVNTMTPVTKRDGKYFYLWNETTVYITSNNVATQNQLTIGHAMTVNLYKCVMVARSVYTSKLSGQNYNGSANLATIHQGSITTADQAAMGNIVLSNAYDVSAYTVRVNINGENTVACVTRNTALTSTNDKKTINFYSANNNRSTKLNIAFVTGNTNYQFYNLTVSDYRDTTYNATYKDNCDYFVSGAVRGYFNNCVVNMKNKRFSTNQGQDAGFSLRMENSTVATIKDVCAVYGLDVYSSSNVHVLGNCLGNYRCLNISGDATRVLVEGSAVTAWDVNNSGFAMGGGVLIVKGTYLDIGYAASISGGIVIANLITMTRQGTFSGGTIITNQITNTVYNWSTGAVSYTQLTGTTESPASNGISTVNGDNLPFGTYYEGQAVSNGTYTFNGAAIYLFGTYKTKAGSGTQLYDDSYKLTSEGNPVRVYANLLMDTDAETGYSTMKSLSYSGSTVTVGGTAVISDAILQSAIQSSTNSNECILLGRSQFDGTGNASRQFNLSGAKIFAAGNLTFYNPTSITGGTVWCGGNLTCKNDLSISGGTVTANVVGNVYALTYPESADITRYRTTRVTGGTLNITQLGSPADTDSVTNRGTLVVSGSPTIKARSSGSVAYKQYMYVNYVGDTGTYNKYMNATEGSVTYNTTPLTFTGTISNATISGIAMEGTYALKSPTLVSDSSQGSWRLDSLNGKYVDAVTAAGLLQYAGTTLSGTDMNNNAVSGNAYKDRTSLNLYAVKSAYTLTLKTPGTIAGQTASGAAFAFTNNVASVNAGDTVVLTLNEAKGDKTVVWYSDESGNVYNVQHTEGSGTSLSYKAGPVVSSDKKTVTFLMPSSNAEIWVTDDLTLYLDKYEIAFTSTGFRTEFTTSDSNKVFTYKGNLTISDSRLTNIRNNSNYLEGSINNGASYDRYAYVTTNRMAFESGCGTSNINRTITFKMLLQSGENNTNTGSTGDASRDGIVIRGADNLNLVIDGLVRLGGIRCNNVACVVNFSGKTGTSGKTTTPPDLLWLQAARHRWDGNTYFAIFGGSNTTFNFTNMAILERYGGNNNIGGTSGVYQYECGMVSTSKAVTYKNVRLIMADAFGPDHATYQSIGTLTFDNCNLGTLYNCSGYYNVFTEGCTTVNYKDTNIDNYWYGSTSDSEGWRSGQFFNGTGTTYNITGSSTIKISQRTDSTRYTREGQNTEAGTVNIKDNAQVTQTHHLTLRTLNVSGNGSLTVTNTLTGTYAANDGLLEVLTMNVSGGSVKAQYIVNSGYYRPNYGDRGKFEADVMTALQNQTYIQTTGTATISGGTVEAGKFFGGDKTSTITITGGTVRAPAIGTYGALFGYAKNIDIAKWIYMYERLPIGTGTTINVKGGTVEVPASGYLGGMLAKVNISGGTVNVADGAVIGITDAQRAKLATYESQNSTSLGKYSTVTITGGIITASGTNKTGVINTPNGSTIISAASATSYPTITDTSILAESGSVTISGANTDISIPQIYAENGTVGISQVNNLRYANGYTSADARHDKTAIQISSLIRAQNLSVTNGAIVFAKTVEVNVPGGSTGSLTVDQGDTTRAYLYTNGYGTQGEGTVTTSYDDSINATKNIFGTPYVKITYVLNPEGIVLDEDLDDIVNLNLTEADAIGNGYSSTISDKIVNILNAECDGYVFEGWYEIYSDGSYSGKLTQVNTKLTTDRTLYAKWSRKTVQFVVQIDNSLTHEDSDLSSRTTVVSSSGDTVIYQYKTPFTVEYGREILTNNAETGLELGMYDLADTMIKTVSMLDTRVFAQARPITVANNLTVSKEMLEAYEQDQTPLVIRVTSTTQLIYLVSVVFHMNRDANEKPKGIEYSAWPRVVAGRFDTDYEDNVTTVNSVSFSALSTYTLQNVFELAQGASMPAPTAPGYNFNGWWYYTGETSTSTEAIDLTKRLNKYSDADTPTITFYASWSPKDYSIRFTVGDVSENTWVTATDVTEGYQSTLTTSNKAQYRDYTWTYDTAIQSGSFKDWSSIARTILPKAWREGYVFSHWYYLDGNNVQHNLTGNEVLDEKTFPTLISDNGLTIYAAFDKATVTYHTNSGSWTFSGHPEDSTADVTDNTLKYGDALKAYSTTEPSGNATSVTVRNGRSGGTITVSGIGTYYIPTTTANGFAALNNGYVTNDFRNTIQRKGYSFIGWNTEKNGTGTWFGCGPRFKSIDVYAQWQGNQYTLSYSNKNSDGYSYSYTGFYAQTETKNVSVTVGEPVYSSGWPARDGTVSDGAWYVNNSGGDTETTRRYLLGITFAPLDPGSSADASGSTGNNLYSRYGDTVSKIQNGTGAIFQSSSYQGTTMTFEGTKFFLPDEAEYRANLTAVNDDGQNAPLAGNTLGTNVNNVNIPDYPDGCTISMYAVYRERAIVFVQRYIDDNNTVQEHIVYSCAYNSGAADGGYYDYPGIYTRTDLYNALINEKADGSAYSLYNWYINTKQITSGKEYTSANFTSKHATWAQEAKDNGSYDIMVYTVYLPKTNHPVSLDANSDPTSTAAIEDTYTLIDAFYAGTMSYSVSNTSGLKLVPKAEMESHLTQYSWTTSGVTHTADDTVALVLNVDGTDYDLASAATGSINNITAGKTVTLTLIHSKVIGDTRSYNLGLTFNFNSGSYRLSGNQWLKEAVTVNLVPSLYTVEYTVVLPEAYANLAVKEINEFTRNTAANTFTRTLNSVAYNSDLIISVPEIEGYTMKSDNGTGAFQGWYLKGDSGRNYTSKLNVSVPVGSNNIPTGVVYLSGEYQPLWYELTADANTMSEWTIRFTDGVNSSTYGSDYTEQTDGGALYKIKYHSDVRFEPKSSSSFGGFVRIIENSASENSEAVKLLDYAEELPNYNTYGSGYHFQMKAYPYKAIFDSVVPVYLENGTINIEASGYSQNGVTITWPGDFEILQNAENDASNSTRYVLNISGDLSSRSIYLGNLNVSSDNSIHLESGTTANLKASYNGSASTLSLRNIFVGETSTLNMSTQAGSAKATVNLTPNPDSVIKYAGIGGSSASPKNGTIQLSDLALNITMRGSSASGVGSGTQEATGCGNVTMTNCDLTMEQHPSGIGLYTGTWVGGAGVGTVSVTGSTISLAAASIGDPQQGPIVDGNIVTITRSTLGGSALNTRLPERVHAASALNINGSEVYLSTSADFGDDALLGTNSSGTVTLSSNSGRPAVVDIINAGTGTNNKHYTGQLVLNDADTDLTVNYNRYVDVANGNLTVTSSDGGTTMVRQGSGSSTFIHTVPDKLTVTTYVLTSRKSGYANDCGITTVSGGNTEINIRSAEALTVAALTVGENTTLTMDADLKSTGVGSISSGKTLSVVSNGHTMEFSGNAFSTTASAGKYEQTGGTLKNSGTTPTFGASTLDIDLSGVRFNGVRDIAAKNLTIDDIDTVNMTGAINASGNVVIGGTDSNPRVSTVSVGDAISATGAVTVDAAVSLSAKSITTTNGDIGISTNSATVIQDITTTSGNINATAGIGLTARSIASTNGNVTLSGPIINTTGAITAANGALTVSNATTELKTSELRAKTITLNNNDQVTITNSGAITATGNTLALDKVTLVSVNDVTAPNGAITVTNSAVTKAGNITAGGNIDITGGSVTLAGAVSGQNVSISGTAFGAVGDITASGAMNLTSLSGASASYGTISTTGTGTLTLKDGSIKTASVISGGKDVVIDGTALTVTNAITSAGNTTIKNSAVAVTAKNINSAGTLTITEGTVTTTNDVSAMGNILVQNNANVTAANVTTPKDMTVSASQITATNGKVGSMPTDKDKTTVTISGASTITAVTIGAIGEVEETFTEVVLDSVNASINGTLVRDWYWITYDVGSTGWNTDTLPKVMRTTQTSTNTNDIVVPSDTAVPAAPDGDTENAFRVWTARAGSEEYAVTSKINEIYSTKGILTLGPNTTGLQATTSSSGSTKTVDLTTTTNTDGTATLTLYLWLNPSLEAIVQNGRVFTDLTGTATNAQIDTNGAWTAQLVSSAVAVNNRQYQIVFNQALPEGTDLTLTVLPASRASGSPAYYYYTVGSGESVTTVEFSEAVTNNFTGMGNAGAASSGITYITNAGSSESFRLCVDFHDAATAAAGNYTAMVNLVSGGTTLTSQVINYSLTGVVYGVVSATTSSVSITASPSGDAALAGKNVYLVAELSRDVINTFGVTGTLNGNTGTWISRNEIAFYLGKYGTNVSMTNADYAFVGPDAGTYNIKWTMYAADEMPNILADAVSNTAEGGYTIAARVWPRLAVALSTAQRQIKVGDGLNVAYTLSPTNVEPIITLVKLGESGYSMLTGADLANLTVANGTILFGNGLSAGTYRIYYSINNGTMNDDVVYTFVVWGSEQVPEEEPNTPDETQTPGDEQTSGNDQTSDTASEPADSSGQSVSSTTTSTTSTSTGTSSVPSAIVANSAEGDTGTNGTTAYEGESLGDGIVPLAPMQGTEDGTETSDDGAPPAAEEAGIGHGMGLVLVALSVGAAAAGVGIWVVLGKRKKDDDEEEKAEEKSEEE